MEGGSTIGESNREIHVEEEGGWQGAHNDTNIAEGVAGGSMIGDSNREIHIRVLLNSQLRLTCLIGTLCSRTPRSSTIRSSNMCSTTMCDSNVVIKHLVLKHRVCLLYIPSVVMALFISRQNRCSNG